VVARELHLKGKGRGKRSAQLKKRGMWSQKEEKQPNIFTSLVQEERNNQDHLKKKKGGQAEGEETKQKSRPGGERNNDPGKKKGAERNTLPGKSDGHDLGSVKGKSYENNWKEWTRVWNARLSNATKEGKIRRRRRHQIPRKRARKKRKGGEGNPLHAN